MYFENSHCLKQCLNIGLKQIKQCIAPYFSKAKSNREWIQLCGQPTSLTHPHLIKPNEILPGINLEEIKTRRRNLISKVLEEPDSTSIAQLIIILSSSKVFMSDKIPYVFRQNADYLYFSGCQEPNSALTIAIQYDTKNNMQTTSAMFMQPKDEQAELWDGPRTGCERAVELFGVDESYSLIGFENYITSFVKRHKKCIIWYNTENVVQPMMHMKLCNVLQKEGHNNIVLKIPTLKMHELRLIKSAAEIELAKQSCEIAAKAISKVVESSKIGMSEHQLFATVDFECRMNGAEFLAYPPVVAAGNNANIIHYTLNNQIINDGDMVLMDAGCEFHGYTSDISRTWPINGSFTDEQRVLYEVVLDVQKSLICKLAEKPSLEALFHEMCYLLGKRLKEIHLLPKHFTSEKQLSSGAFMYCPHHVGHYLGMDVHDTNKIAKNVPVEKGMILTVEPGIYVNPRNEYAPSQFHGLGIRIEDDVSVGENGAFTVLSQTCPKEVEDITQLAKMNQHYN